VLIESLPPVLVLYLSRFADSTSSSIVKVAKNIPFSKLLEIPPGTIILLPRQQLRLRISCGSIDLGIMAATARQLSGRARYKLFGVLYHHGEFPDSGHYTVDVLDPNTDVWLHIDDETVNEVRLQDKFPGDRKRGQCSTMLFYHRTTVAKT
jgi:ubiquitin carboxyl-terminal hydrolase 10